jgi:hypothetical protein
MLLLHAAPASAYEILLDIDTDNDPTTINELSGDSTVVVRIVLKPTQPDEWITQIFFGLGGGCWECDGVQDYAIAHDLYPPNYGDWTDHPELVGSWDTATFLGCPGNPGFHDVYFATASGTGFNLQAPVFIASFTAWVSEPMWGWCPLPPRTLAAFHTQDENGYWNYLQIGGPVVSVAEESWGTIKQLFQ